MNGINTMENKNFGKIVDDWRCCDMSLQVYDDSGNLKYKIVGGCCQCAMVCKRYETCYEVCYFIYEAKSPEDEKNAVGKIVRQKKTIGKSIFTDADNFEINFPETATPYDKLMIIGATLMLDYMYFEESPSDEDLESKRQRKIPRSEFDR